MCRATGRNPGEVQSWHCEDVPQILQAVATCFHLKLWMNATPGQSVDMLQVGWRCSACMSCNHARASITSFSDNSPNNYPGLISHVRSKTCSIELSVRVQKTYASPIGHRFGRTHLGNGMRCNVVVVGWAGLSLKHALTCSAVHATSQRPAANIW